MLPWELLDTATTPDGEGALTLNRRGDEYAIRIDGRELMSSRLHGSEESLAELGCAAVGKSACRVLVGGLGMGFTLAACNQVLNDQAHIEVAELLPAGVSWNHGELGLLAGYPLNDPRVTVHAIDVRGMIEAAEGLYDVILRDVDNGPEGLTQKSNSWLYRPKGLRRCHQALTPHGVLAVWSVHPDDAFAVRLEAQGFEVSTHRVGARGGRRGTQHTIWSARR